ncbi:hypothetical protein F444_19363 [Phytophthora nicotianae P1976]|uniref:Uncharacterized protein n=1 Tax=Phytophthora nicotianae P1976 TaxID=1317066 RepID=A0A080Z828_PHYNI|nr:hypothetical protein F444_19363 [Phytophthora nicotianae P1976]
MGEIHEVISSTDGEANPNWEIGENSWNALKLLPEEKDQFVHRDCPTFETARALRKRKLVQGFVIVALMDDTRLHVYPRCFGGHADKEKHKMVTLKRGAVLFFRGDHMLEQSTTLSTFDCTATYKLLGWTKSRIRLKLVFQTFHCDKCLETTYTRKKLAVYLRTCSERGYSGARTKTAHSRMTPAMH